VAALRADAARNRAAILRAAEELLQGAASPGDVSMDAIAEAAGVGKGTLFRRFGDRQGLVSALVEDRLVPLKAAIGSGPPPLGPGTPPVRRILAVLDAMVAFKIEMVSLSLADEHSAASPFTTPSYTYAYDLIRRLLIEADRADGADLAAHVLLAPTRADFIAQAMRAAGGSGQALRAMLQEQSAAMLSR
jgi:AcrR family transcriptional regulator